MLKESFLEYERGQYSPQYIDPSELELGTIITTEQEDEHRLMYARLQLTSCSGSQVIIFLFFFQLLCCNV